MRPNTKSIYFKLSIACFIAFMIQLVFLRGYVQDFVENGDKARYVIQLAFWLGVLWISLGSLFWFKATKNKQTLTNQFLVFILSPVVFAPIIGILQVVVVILPLYDAVNKI